MSTTFIQTLLNSYDLSHGGGKGDAWILSQSDQSLGLMVHRLQPSPCPNKWLQTFLSSLSIINIILTAS